MRKVLIFLIVVFFLGACAHGPVYTAKNEGEAIKKDYQDKRLQDLYSQNQNLLKEIYTRFTASRVDFYKEGLGFTEFTNQRNKRTYFRTIFYHKSYRGRPWFVNMQIYHRGAFR